MHRVLLDSADVISTEACGAPRGNISFGEGAGSNIKGSDPQGATGGATLADARQLEEQEDESVRGAIVDNREEVDPMSESNKASREGEGL